MTAPTTDLLQAALEQAGLAFTLHGDPAPRATLRLVGGDSESLAVTADLAAGALRLTAHDVFHAPVDEATLWQVNDLNQRLAPVRVFLAAAGGFTACVSLYAGDDPPDPGEIAFAARQLLQLRNVRVLDELLVDAPPGEAAILLESLEASLTSIGLRPTRLHDGHGMAVRPIEPDGHEVLIELFTIEDRLLVIRGRHPHSLVVPHDGATVKRLQPLNERLAFGAAVIADEGWPYFVAAQSVAWIDASENLARWLVDATLSSLAAIDRDLHGLTYQ
jgi:Putative bacterial sensory transduction regulator